MRFQSAKFQTSGLSLPFCPVPDLPVLAKVPVTPGDGCREVIDCIAEMHGGLAPVS